MSSSDVALTFQGNRKLDKVCTKNQQYRLINSERVLQSSHALREQWQELIFQGN